MLLFEQDRARWDRVLVKRGLDALERCAALGGSYGPYALQAAIAACHARARDAAATDWPRIVILYEALAVVAPTPVVELNHAVAVAMAFEPALGLECVDDLIAERTLEGYHLVHAVHGDLLRKLGRFDEAHAELVRAAGLTRNERESELLLERAELALREGTSRDS